ncbi:NAD-dependent succinate-semialdehyde dehydrogenase [Arthrobacter sp. EpRS71]|uniref:NAD-dependent succinate-semialdehyde dehydrogenase n=1 Tax=Arthrobacter sp. EpRS71 TaxID=1743141 RepID=UPI00074733F9|nr:NAD-dependent succinate-semialdehyde dehydrogenase [Arthrobacter sp. EpRS71]KUM36378.1 NAD-dependent succinate-semialdehyde dehydrogenase [Arthrobacter sp. EpRS71]
MTLSTEVQRLRIGGQPSDSSNGDTFPVHDPATGAVIAEVHSASVADGVRAAETAESVLPEWGAKAPRERAEILRAGFENIRAHRAELAEIIVSENGKVYADALSEADYAAEFFRWFSEEAVRLPGSLRESPSGARRILEVSQPVGVVLAITPWNLPAAMVTRKVAPALAAGCTVVVKPSNQTPLTALRIAELLEEAGLPSGAVNVIPTIQDKEVVGELMSRGPVRMVSFTGSTAVGRQLIAQASERVLNVGMELGGNAPFLVFEDADIDAAVEGALTAKMRHNAEACIAANRFYVHESVRDEFTRAFSAAMSRLKVGPGRQSGVDVGPLASSAALTGVNLAVEAALADGATRIVGGNNPSGPGYYFNPTVLSGVSADAAILNHEWFAPVAPIVGFESEDEVVGLANATEMGLGSYVYSSNLKRALRVAERIDAGMVGINTGVFSDPAAPFGGTRQSGIGREGGHHGLHEFLETKYIAVDW